MLTTKKFKALRKKMTKAIKKMDEMKQMKIYTDWHKWVMRKTVNS